MIVIRNLCKFYGRFQALDHISLSFNSGIITGLLGMNGAGKSTLLSILATVSEYDSGEILVFGQNLAENKKNIRKILAWIPQEPAFYDQMTVAENLDFFAVIRGLFGTQKKARLEAAAANNRLESLMGRRAGALSGGEKQRLNIAIGMLGDPEIMLFDEPTVGLDVGIRQDLLMGIRALKRPGRVIIYTSHYLDEIEKLCDEAAIIHQGRARVVLDRDAMRREAANKTLERHFLSMTEPSHSA
ncbi:MAG: ABC transporter ATP-binding protein [Desulfobulbaceae bacterium]|jgi:ABC-2 type transport system ATP-binding protein|nr:ABC transporter ATP-binding protein [Desulfobulbaceae bacterium]